MAPSATPRVHVTVDVDAGSDIRAFTLDHGENASLYVGGDPESRYTNLDHALEIYFRTAGDEAETLLAIDRLIGGLETLRQAVINHERIDQQIVAAGRGEAVAA